MNYLTLFLNLFTLTMQGMMHLIFIGRLTGKTLKYRYFAAYLVLLNLMELVFSAFSVPAILAIGAELLMLYTIHRFLSKNHPMISLTASVLALYITQLSFGMMNAIEVIILPYFLGKTTLLYLLIFLSAILTCVLCFCCYHFLVKNLSLNEEDIPYIELLLFPVLFFFFIELYILQTAYSIVPVHILDSFTHTGKHFLLLVMQALGLAALFCTQYAWQRTCRSFQTQAALASLTQAAQAQKTYIAEAQMRDEQTRAFRHDIRNHLSVLHGLLNTENLEAAQSYLQKLENISSFLSFPCPTGNPTIDILLSEKLERAKNCGISTDISLLLPANDVIDDFDLCIIFSNALDNAINACLSILSINSKTSEPSPFLHAKPPFSADDQTAFLTDDQTAHKNSEQPFIHILGEQQGDFYRLEFTNTCFADPIPPMGIGLKNIQAAALKYHGAMQTEKKGHCFCLHVLLNIR